MDRRLLLKFASISAFLGFDLETTRAADQKGQVVLYNDLTVDPKREQEMLDHFHRDIKPAAEKFEGYVDVKMVKIRKVIQGQPAPPPGVNYRYQLTFESEELRQRWVNSSVHRANWPRIESTLLSKDYLVLLTESV